ncbi:MAG TPA: hypothetical protein VMU59_06405 [Caulobacteraceae bacterium]|nr:hypothetical protein [Caulobacteraceae bacterium]
MSLGKEQIARRQLGTALALFLDDLDPVSVHCLACGGGEVAETLTQRSGREPFSTHALNVVPDLTQSKLRKIRTRYWNAFKHALDHGGLDRQDAETIAEFDDTKNDHVLFVGWYDIMLASGKMPIEAQAFQVWYLAKYPEKLAPAHDIKPYQIQFPNISFASRAQQKAMLRTAISERRTDLTIMGDRRTEQQPLILGVI